MNPTVDQVFGLLEEDPAVKELPYKKQFDKYQHEINYEEKAADQRRAETSEPVHRSKRTEKKDGKNKSKSPKKGGVEDIVAQRDRQFALAKKYKEQVRESVERRTIKSRGVETQLSEQPLSADYNTHSPPAGDKLLNSDIARVYKQ
jgi:hypothetical protein